MTWFLAVLRTRLGQAAAVVLATLAAIGLARAKWRSEGRTEAERRMRDDAHDRVEKGRDAVRDGDPADRLRKNDGQW